MNQKNSTQPIEASNLSIEQSLLSRFDLVFDLERPTDPLYNLSVINHILDVINNGPIEGSWSHERLQMHIQIAKEIRVEITDDARRILQQYYLFCKNQEEIEPSRRTLRLLDSLHRLTVCNAKLMLRTKAGIDDAVSVVMLMESTWSFGHLLPSESVLRSKVPLGPTRAIMAEVLDKLNLNELLEKRLSQTSVKVTQESDLYAPIDKTIVDDMFSDEIEPEVLSTQQIFSTQANMFPIKRQTSFPFTQTSPTLQPAKSFNDSLNVSTFKSPQSTSTQFGSINEKSTKQVVSSQNKKSQLEVDPLYSNLNALSAFYTDNSAVDGFKAPPLDNFLTPPPSQTSKRSPPSSALSKLKKFKYSDDTQPQPTESAKNVPENVQKENLQVKVIPAQEKQISVDDFDEEMDFFDF